jgi:hypothetical protein
VLQHRQKDPDLAGIRDRAAVAKLPADEQEACKKLWTDMAALLKKIAAQK